MSIADQQTAGCRRARTDHAEVIRKPVTGLGISALLAGVEFGQAAGHRDGLAEAGATVDAHHGAGGDGVGEVLPHGEQRAGGDQTGLGRVMH
ncbi:hypothetical protein [Kitasatospora sp. NPDC056531]|uniref:hypothetical protein n=1 Tax=Kitasatospora sp. NPDC056531 TaxID=3345856 RepID=UPI0036821ED8